MIQFTFRLLHVERIDPGSVSLNPTGEKGGGGAVCVVLSAILLMREQERGTNTYIFRISVYRLLSLYISVYVYVCRHARASILILGDAPGEADARACTHILACIFIQSRTPRVLRGGWRQKASVARSTCLCREFPRETFSCRTTKFPAGPTIATNGRRAAFSLWRIDTS